MAALLLLVGLGLGVALARALPGRGGPDEADTGEPPGQDDVLADDTHRHDLERIAEVDQPTTPTGEPIDPRPRRWELGPRILDLLKSLPGMAIVINNNGRVVHASEEAVRQRLVRLDRLASDELAEAADACLAERTNAIAEITLLRPPKKRGRLDLRVRTIYMQGDYAVLLLEDLTEETRLTSIRRDFIANISHELKTPVGAMSLLSEALVAASDDEESVKHFAERLQSEAGRLSRLITDVIELSRLQGEDPLSDPTAVHIEGLVLEALESVASAAEVKGIQVLLSSGGRDLTVGNEGQLLIALTNLLTNAIAYSEPNTQVAIVVRPAGAFVEVEVKDQGIGIPESELDRIFERFYRIDAARSRATGGTGLGLAIARNVCKNHGGSISVWSVEGEGSTFTMRLPIPGQGLLADLDPMPRSANREVKAIQVIPSGVSHGEPGTDPAESVSPQTVERFDPGI